MSGRNLKFRKWLGNLLQLHPAALGDLPRPVHRILKLAENRHHLSPRFQIKLGLVEAHPVGIADSLTGLDAQHDFMRAGICLAHIMRIIGRYQRNARFFR